eukprot:3612404-Alexandrium_andersonii.AAC.1
MAPEPVGPQPRTGEDAMPTIRPLSTRHHRGAWGLDELRQFCQDSRRYCLAPPPALSVSAPEDSPAQLR